jgi:hypothetical protein
MTYPQLLQPPPLMCALQILFTQTFFHSTPNKTLNSSPILSPHTLLFHVPGTNYLTTTTISNSKLALTVSPTLTDHPRANLVPSKLPLNWAARGVIAEWDTFGFMFCVCDDAIWALLNTLPGGQLRVGPDFPEPAALATGANPAARVVFKCATESGQRGSHVQPLSVWLSLIA